MSASITLKAAGLNVQPNQLDLPPGSLAVASNVIIKRDGVIEPRRGYPLYGNAMGSSSDRAKQLMTYKNRILRHFSNQLQYDSDGAGKFLSFCGTYLEPEVGRRIRFKEANGNFYFTTSNGIEKISAKTAADFTTACPYITPAGGIKALDLSAVLDFSLGLQSGFLPPDSAVAYRQVWGYTDANGNLVLGSPTARVVVFNPLSTMVLMDFNNILNQLNNISANVSNPSLITALNFFSSLNLGPSASAQELQANLIALAAKLDQSILYADQVSVAPLQIGGASINSGIGTISFSSGNPANYFVSGSNILLNNFTPTTGSFINPTTGVANEVVSTLVPTFTTTGNTTLGVAESTSLTTIADINSSLNSSYFLINSANDATQYYVWLNSDNTGTDPNVSGKTGIRVNISANDSANTVAANIRQALNGFNADFITSGSTNNVVITNTSIGATTDATMGTTGFSIVSITQGTDSNIITSVASTSGINVGVIVTSPGHIAAGTYVTAVGINTITLSQNAISNTTGATLNFDAAINFNTTAGGPVSFSNATIHSYEYEIIAQPAVPSIPTTDAQLLALQNYLLAIITRLQSETSTGTPPTISSNSQTNFLSTIQLTNSANVLLTFTIPAGVTVNDFYQIYRSDIVTASQTQVLATDIAPSDELKLVFEGFPTAQDIINGFITVLDVTPQAFAGAFLYTNATTGEGILQANDLPPFALDINNFKNVMFYANTRTRQRLDISLLGVEQMIAEINAGTIPTITLSDGTTTTTYTFVLGVAQIVQINTVADVSGNLAGKYFTINDANDTTSYYIWYKVNGVGTDPLVANKTGVLVDLVTNDSANTVAIKTSNVINTIVQDFTSVFSTNHITVTNINEGSAAAPTNGTSGFTSSVLTPGVGADPSLNQILLSNVISPAQAVDQTARSLIDIINRDPNSPIYAYYLSGPTGVPGQILFEARSLTNSPFFIVGNNSQTGLSFNPDISPTIQISSISIANPTVITTSTPHGLINQNQVMITNSNSTPSVNGVWTISYISPTSFSIPVNVTVAGTRGALINITTAVTSDNEVLPNRIYFSKILQPDAVPLVNTIDVGAKDKAILRIFPLRDSLFVYKEDGLFRISGETAPFNLALFDSSCILLAPDSLDVSNNLIYGWTTQGITSTSESGVNIVSRPIDIDILKLATEQYTNFKSATWGIGYESDNSYTVYTVQETTDLLATIGYRFSTLTNTWTTFDKTDTCGVINSFNDRQYLGAGDTDFLEQERKDFDRYDYADRELTQNLVAGDYFGDQILFSNIADFAVGDVLTQDQTISIFQFNTLLTKLDSDVFLTDRNYFSTLQLLPGGNARNQLDLLLAKIATDAGRLAQPGADPGSSYTVYESNNSVVVITGISASDPTVITTFGAHNLTSGRIITISGSDSVPNIDGTYPVTVLTSNTFTIPVSVQVAGTTGSLTVNNNDFADIESSYNGMILTLNNDTGTAFNNYQQIVNNTLQEAIITKVNISNKRVTLNNKLDFLIGPLTIFKSIKSNIQWAPQTFGDPLNLKHVREATTMFENKAFTSATLSFSSDLLPSFIDVPVLGTGNGIFGYTGIPASVHGVPGPTGFGYGFFGGASNSAPSRTYIPRDVQRCRYLNCQFTHSIAREKYSLFGITLTGEIGQSSRAYR